MLEGQLHREERNVLGKINAYDQRSPSLWLWTVTSANWECVFYTNNVFTAHSHSWKYLRSWRTTLKIGGEWGDLFILFLTLCAKANQEILIQQLNKCRCDDTGLLEIQILFVLHYNILAGSPCQGGQMLFGKSGLEVKLNFEQVLKVSFTSASVSLTNLSRIPCFFPM